MASALEPLVPRQLSGVRFVGGDQLHNLAFLGATLEQFRLEGANASANLEYSSSVAVSARDACHHPALERTKALPSISLQVLPRHSWLENLFACPSAAATRHDSMIPLHHRWMRR